MRRHRFGFGNRIARELSARGLEKEAQQISLLVRAKTPFAPEQTEKPVLAPANPVIPTHCPACGGPIRSNEVDWIDPVSIECPFCGSPVRAQ